MPPKRRRYQAVRSAYRPFPLQREAHAAGQRMINFRGGKGSGKTTWACHELMNMARMNPGGRILALSPTYASQNRALIPKIVETFPGAIRFPRGPSGNARRDLGPLAKEWNAAARVLTLWNDSRIFFASADYIASFDGIEAAGVVIDEPKYLTEASWEIVRTRLRQPGYHHRLSMSGEPNMGWIYDEFGPGRDKATRYDVQVSTLDNPHVSDAFKADFESMSERRRTVLRDGGWQAQTGVVYSEEYTPTLEGSLIDVLPEPSRLTWMTCDPGGSPYAAFVQRLEDGTDVVVAEVICNSPRSHEHAQLIVEEANRWKMKIDHLVIDVQARQKDHGTTRPVSGTYLGVLHRAGVLRSTARRWMMCKSAVERHIQTGVDRVRDRLLSPSGVRGLKVAVRLTTRAHHLSLPEDRVGMDRSFRNYHYPDGKPTDKPEKDGITDHAMDAIRYWAVMVHGVLSAADMRERKPAPVPIEAARRTADDIQRPTW